MQAASSRIGAVKPVSRERLSGLPSPALEWLWKYLADVRQPRFLHCGPVRWNTIELLLQRNAKLYLGDAISPLLNENARFWDRRGKTPVFKIEDFMAEFPAIPPATLTAAFCWHLFDVLPRGLVPQVLEKLMSFIAPGGVLFCMLREPYLRTGVDAQWWMEDLRVIVSTRLFDRPFPNPVVTTREIEKVVPPGSLKVFLTRSGRREVIALK
jgi:hypothetical protein